MKTRISVILLALSFAGCHPQQPQEVPTPPAAPDNPAPSPAAPVDSTPAAPAQPTPDAPSPTESSPTAKPTAQLPAVDSMALARPSAKMSVPVDLRYALAGPVIDGQPVT